MRYQLGDLGFMSEVVAFRCHERRQTFLDRRGYGLCEFHSSWFWSSHIDEMREWHIALQNYEEARVERDVKRLNFAALPFQKARISILHDDASGDISYISATVLLLHSSPID